MNKIEKSELLLALYAKQEEAKEKIKNAQSKMVYIFATEYKRAIDSVIQMVTDDF